jgi:hypothetical protein
VQWHFTVIRRALIAGAVAIVIQYDLKIKGGSMKPAIALFPVLTVALLLAGAPVHASSKMDNRIENGVKKVTNRLTVAGSK